MIKKLAAALCLAATMLVGTDAVAVPISGSIDFTGQLTTDTGNIAAATQIKSLTNIAIAIPTLSGDYLPVGLELTSTPVSTGIGIGSPLVLNPLGGSALPLWTFTLDNGAVYSFDLDEITGVDQGYKLNGLAYLDVYGVGTAYISGPGLDFTPTSGAFLLTTQGNKTTVTFSANTAVPDGGSTAVLLGLTMFGFAAVRSKLQHA